MSDPAVRTTDLSREFGRAKALDQLNLVVPRGTILTLLGPNGAGKTTLLRILMGLIEPTGGQAFVLDSPSRLLVPDVAGRIAYVGDRCEPPDWATPALLEDLQADASDAFDKALFRDYCRRREIRSKRVYRSLSKGQRGWLLTSLALASGPELMLLDEPANGLDPAARKSLYEAIRDHVNACAATAIVTTHVIGDVERVADDVAILDAGRLSLQAPLEDLRECVRQVEMPVRDAAPDLDDVGSVLGGVQAGATRIVWIKRDGLADEELCRRFGAGVVVRHVDLETLYLAVAEHRVRRESSNEGDPLCG